MPYINERGVISNSRPLLSSVTDFFWGVINVAYLFIRTLIEPGLQSSDMQQRPSHRNEFRSSSGGGGYGRGPPGPPRRRMGGFSDSCAPGSPPMMGGG